MAPALPLSSAQRRRLKSLAHALRPVVQIGKGGLSESVVQAVDGALTDHELIKVRLPQVDKAERVALSEQLTSGTESERVALVGRIAVLYRRHPEEPRIRV